VAIDGIRHETIDVYKSETTVASECTTLEQRSVVRFLWAKGVESKNIHKEMLPIYGEKCPSRQAVSNWVQKFSEGRTRIEDEHRIGRPNKDCHRGKCVTGSRLNPSR
jgi:hypothetical protein